MNTNCNNNNNQCQYYKSNNDIGFKIISSHKGEIYVGKKYYYHTLVFVLEGLIEFSYNDFLNYRFSKADLFFLPQATEMYGTALDDSKLLILTFASHINTICDNCCKPNQMKPSDTSKQGFTSLKLTDTMFLFIEVLENYIREGSKCILMDKLKQKELFILMAANYSQEELQKLFYPITGKNLAFKTKVLEKYRYGLSFQDLAQQFGMSYSTFFKKFKAEFNEPIQQWVLKQKAKHIKLRLSIPTVTQADIIHDFGFTDAPHFNKFCRKLFGCTPNELIKELRENKTL